MLKSELEQYHIVLASQSPRRRELFGRLHVPFLVLPAKGEETVQGELPEDIVMNLARQKAEEVYGLKKADFEGERQPLLVIGADTIVVFEKRILGKPQSRENACEMLRMLSGKSHQVYTGVCILRELQSGMGGQTHRQAKCCFFEKTDVSFAELTDEEIWEYIDSGDSFDKAGGYGIQGDFSVYVRGISGDYNNVVGLPLARLYQELKGILQGENTRKS